MSSNAKTGKPMILGMIGVGGFGGFRRQSLRASGLFKIVACYDRNAETLARACAEEGATAVASVDELIHFPGLEGLVVSTGVDTHTDLTIRGLDAGLHVLVEKPLCGRVEEVEALLEARKRSGKIVATGHADHATDWAYKLIKEYMNNGKLGIVACYEENSSHSGGLEIRPGDWRGIRERNPGGMLLQCGVHALHRLNHIFGPVKSVQAMFRYDVNSNTQTADVASALLRHESGMVGTLNCYHVTAYNHEFKIFGTKGNLYLDTHAKTAFFQERLRGPVETRVEVPIPMGSEGDWYSNVVNWYNAVRFGGNASPSLDDGINAVLPVFAAEISDEQGRRVDIAELSGVAANA